MQGSSWDAHILVHLLGDIGPISKILWAFVPHL
jgi:hypothetical protein